jgi:hypothetical protein
MSLISAGKNGKNVFISGNGIRGRLETTHIFSATPVNQDSKLVRMMLCLRGKGKLRIIVYSALRIFEIHHCYRAQGH